MPERIQLRRTKGWRLPEGAVKVDRTTKYGNPFQLKSRDTGLVRYGPHHLARFGRAWDHEGRISAHGNRHNMWFSRDDIVETYVRYATQAEVVELHRLTLTDPTPGMISAYPSAGGRFAKVTVDEIRAELAGKDVACWCKPTEPCHGDTLIELANPGPPTPMFQGLPAVRCEGSRWEPNSGGLCRTCGAHWFTLAGEAGEPLPEHLRVDILRVAEDGGRS